MKVDISADRQISGRHRYHQFKKKNVNKSDVSSRTNTSIKLKYYKKLSRYRKAVNPMTEQSRNKSTVKENLAPRNETRPKASQQQSQSVEIKSTPKRETGSTK